MSNTNSEYNAKLPQDKKSNFAKPRQIQQDINQQHVKFQNELDTDFTDKEARLVSSQEDFPSQPQIQLQISQNPQKKSLWKRVMSDIGKIQGKIFQKLPLRILLNLRKSKLQKSLSKQKSTLQHQSQNQNNQPLQNPHQKPLWRRILRKIHLWLGLATTIPLIVIAVTGIILSALFFAKDFQVTVSSAKPYIASPGILKKVVDVAHNYEDNSTKLMLVRFPEKKDGKIMLRLMNMKSRDITQVFLETKTLSVHKIEKGTTFEHFVLKLHYSFMFDFGKTIVGIIGIILCIMCISGFFIWFPKKGYFRSNLKNIGIPKFSLNGRALNINLHKSFGIWMVFLLITIAFSGVFLVFPKAFQSAISQVSNIRDPRNSIIPHHSISTVEIESAAEGAIRAAVRLTNQQSIIAVQIPQKPNDNYRFTILPDNYNGRNGITVFVAQDSTILEVRNPNAYSKGESFLMWLGILHKGNGLGIIWRLIQITIGSAVLLFAYTGFMIWWKKPKKA